MAEATAAREAALADTEARVRAAELEREQAVEDIGRALRELRMPGPGEELARLPDAVLYRRRINTPDGRGPVDGAVAHVDSAAELWKSQRELLAELLRLEVAGAARFHDSLTAGGDEGYLLLVTRHVRSIVPFPPGDAAAAQEFVRRLEKAASGYAAEQKAWEEQVRAANAEAQSYGILSEGPHHGPETMFEDVYKEMPWHLHEQLAELKRFRKPDAMVRLL